MLLTRVILLSDVAHSITFEVLIIISSVINRINGISIVNSLSFLNGTYLGFPPSLLCTIEFLVLYIRSAICLNIFSVPDKEKLMEAPLENDTLFF